MELFLAGFVTGSILGLVLMACIAARNVNALIRRISELEDEKEDEEWIRKNSDSL